MDKPLAAQVYKSAIEALSEGLLFFDVQSGQLWDANPAAAQMTGYSRTQLQQMNLLELGVRKEILPLLRRLAHKPVLTASVSLRTAKGSVLCLGITLHRLPAEAGGLAILKKKDTSRQLARQLEKQNRELQKINQLKSEFVANISHELRTPLTTILGWPEIILDMEGLPDISLRAARAIQKDGQLLLTLLEDIIDLSKIEAGQLQLDMRYEDLNRVIGQAVQMVAESARQQRLELSFAPNAALPLVKMDPVRVTQVILNYLSNALKFTPAPGQIRLAVSHDGDSAVVAVQDTGIGIDADHQAFIFERFTQVNGTSTRSAGGSGLGLSLARSLIALHGGRTWVESQLGHGAAFFFSLPLVPVSASKTEYPARLADTLPADAAQWASQPIKVLLADDREDILAVLRAMLTSQTIEVSATTAAAEVLELALQHQPDCILLDIAMPDNYQSHVFKQLRQHPKTCHTPVVALTALAMKGDREHFLSLGYDAYLSKPCRKAELLDCIHKVLAARSYVS